MANIDLGNLTRYDGKIKEYAEDKYLSKNTANWQKTEKAGAVTCYPVPDTELELIVDFSFKEVSPISGDKSPTNPSIITGISSITVTQCETTGVDETQYTVNLNNTYYDGSLNISTGLLTITHFSTTSSTLSSVARIRTNTITFNLSVGYTYNGFLTDCFTSNVFDCYKEANDLEHIAWRNADTSQSSYLYINKSRLDVSNAVDPSSPTDEEWLAAGTSWIQSNPIQVVGCLAAPQIIALDSTKIRSISQLDKNTPRLNTLYTDADSIQVGYQKHPARTSYELENAILALGGNE